ncbi:hypothetical protein [Micromonospora sp. CPCC 206060]|uniref:hypothetical protein n=1 Tax=Micromonospora sp. CPCC 206060 TaxID=3122406 RepID=UPI002FF3A1A7
MKRGALPVGHWPWTLLALVVFVCTGALSVPAGWAVSLQVEAERGEPAPSAAALVYLLRLSSGDDGGLYRVLAADRRDSLVDQWRGYRADMRRATPPSKLESGPLQVTHLREGVALVVTDVYAVWWQDRLSMSGSRHHWRFEVRKDQGGWRVWKVEAPAWCDTYVRTDRC